MVKPLSCAACEPLKNTCMFAKGTLSRAFQQPFTWEYSGCRNNLAGTKHGHSGKSLHIQTTPPPPPPTPPHPPSMSKSQQSKQIRVGLTKRESRPRAKTERLGIPWRERGWGWRLLVECSENSHADHISRIWSTFINELKTTHRTHGERERERQTQ